MHCVSSASLSCVVYSTVYVHLKENKIYIYYYIHVYIVHGYNWIRYINFRVQREDHTLAQRATERERERVGKKMRNQQEKAFMKPLRTQNLPFFFIL